jgi:Sigma-70, region 4
LLRFFENWSLAEIGERLGFGESGASRRVTRALEKLRLRLAKRGIATTAVALTAVLSAHGVQAAPAEVAVNLVKTALANAAAGHGTALTLLKGTVASKVGRSVTTCGGLGGPPNHRPWL